MLKLFFLIITLGLADVYIGALTNNLYPSSGANYYPSMIDCYHDICNLLSYEYENTTFVGVMIIDSESECQNIHSTLPAQMLVAGVDDNYQFITGTATTCNVYGECIVSACNIWTNTGAITIAVTGGCR